MITRQPVDQLNVMSGSDVMFSVTATGDGIIFQWQKDGTNIDDLAGTYSGTNTNTLTVLSVTDPEDEGVYSVLVTNIAGSQDSNDVQLRISELERIFFLTYLAYPSSFKICIVGYCFIIQNMTCLPDFIITLLPCMLVNHHLYQKYIITAPSLQYFHLVCFLLIAFILFDIAFPLNDIRYGIYLLHSEFNFSYVRVMKFVHSQLTVYH